MNFCLPADGWVMSPKSSADPPVEICMNSIVFTTEGFRPLTDTARVPSATAAPNILTSDKVPKLTAFPVVDKVIRSIVSTGGLPPPKTTARVEFEHAAEDPKETVSYTHLTLPTICSV